MAPDSLHIFLDGQRPNRMSCKERADGGDWQLSSLIFSQSYVLHNSGASHILGNKYMLDLSEKLTEVALFQLIF